MPLQNRPDDCGARLAPRHRGGGGPSCLITPCRSIIRGPISSPETDTVGGVSKQKKKMEIHKQRSGSPSKLLTRGALVGKRAAVPGASRGRALRLAHRHRYRHVPTRASVLAVAMSRRAMSRSISAHDARPAGQLVPSSCVAWGGHAVPSVCAAPDVLDHRPRRVVKCWRISEWERLLSPAARRRRSSRACTGEWRRSCAHPRPATNSPTSEPPPIDLDAARALRLHSCENVKWRKS